MPGLQVSMSAHTFSATHILTSLKQTDLLPGYKRNLNREIILKIIICDKKKEKNDNRKNKQTFIGWLRIRWWSIRWAELEPREEGDRADFFFRFTPCKNFLRLYFEKYTKVNKFTKKQLILGLLTKVNRFTLMQNVSAISLLQCSTEFT